MNNSPEKRVSLRVIADSAKVSRMTVSLALRNHPSIPPNTRVRIQKLAQQFGYRPDPEISHLMERIREKRSKQAADSIAYLTAYDERMAWKREPTQRMYHEGAARRAREHGYSLEEFCLCDRGMTDRALSNIIYNRGIQGVIVAPLPVAAPRFEAFRWERFSAVEIGYSLREPALHRSCNHQFQSMMLLIQKLHEAGYNRIGLAMNPAGDQRANYSWSAAHYVAGNLWGNRSDVPPLISGEWCRASLADWIAKRSPEVVVTAGGEVESWLAELGLEVPDDIGLANVNLWPEMTGTTGINQNSESVGATAVDLLVASTRQNELGIPRIPRVVMTEGTYILGKTIRNIGSAAGFARWQATAGDGGTDRLAAGAVRLAAAAAG